MTRSRPLRFYCDESGNTGTHWLDPEQPILVHGGWLFPEGAEVAVAEGMAGIRRRHRLQAPELKWAQFARSGREHAFRDVVELCLKHGVMPMFMVMDKQYATAAKVVETFFDPAYNHHLPMAFTGDFETKKGIAEAVRLSPDLVATFGPWLRERGAPPADEVRAFADRLAEHLNVVGIPSLAGTLHDVTDAEVENLRGEFDAEPMMRSTTWTVLWAMVAKVLEFVRPRGLEVEIFQDQIVRFDALVGMIGNQPGVTRVELVDSKLHLGVQLADLLCGFLRDVFAKIAAGEALTKAELANCADLFMLTHEFESWSGNLPESTWAAFASVAVPEVRRRYGSERPDYR